MPRKEARTRGRNSARLSSRQKRTSSSPKKRLRTQSRIRIRFWNKLMIYHQGPKGRWWRQLSAAMKNITAIDHVQKLTQMSLMEHSTCLIARITRDSSERRTRWQSESGGRGLLGSTARRLIPTYSKLASRRWKTRQRSQLAIQQFANSARHAWTSTASSKRAKMLKVETISKSGDASSASLPTK